MTRLRARSRSKLPTRRRTPLSAASLAWLLLSCGSRSQLEVNDAGVAPQGIVGSVIATTEDLRGRPEDRLDVNMQASSGMEDCSNSNATLTIGPCCYFAPRPRPGTMPPGSGMPATESSAGAITLVDATSHADIGTYTYGSGGYPSLPMTYAPPVWQPGDTLTVRATGDEIGAFTVSAPALSAPVAQVPSSIVVGQDTMISWQPDPNAETMLIQIVDGLNGAVVACVVPDAQGDVTISAQLYATSFHSRDRCGVAASRSTDRYAQTPTGRVQFETVGWAIYDTTIQ